MYIQTFTKVNGFAPTRCEIAHAVGISLSTVNRYVHIMEKEGVLKLKPRKARAIVLKTRVI